MAPQSVSLLVQCWREPRDGATRLRVLRITQGEPTEEVRLNDGSFLVRIALGQGRAMERCFIRHISSTREAYVQGGPGLGDFIQECLVASEGI